jgi:hypothetical protein
MLTKEASSGEHGFAVSEDASFVSMTKKLTYFLDSACLGEGIKLIRSVSDITP